MERFIRFTPENSTLALVTPQSQSFAIWCDEREHKGVLTAVHNLQTDFGKVTTATPCLSKEKGRMFVSLSAHSTKVRLSGN
ncbi:hypothetical protein NXX49_16180 [Candidatus Bacteroides intestinigallinarum]|nr:hypothetical protein [Candidatus Bacteroides intestinigallinarum]